MFSLGKNISSHICRITHITTLTFINWTQFAWSDVPVGTKESMGRKQAFKYHQEIKTSNHHRLSPSKQQQQQQPTPKQPRPLPLSKIKSTDTLKQNPWFEVFVSIFSSSTCWTKHVLKRSHILKERASFFHLGKKINHLIWK